jgi:hypothetical protein
MAGLGLRIGLEEDPSCLIYLLLLLQEVLVVGLGAF